MKPTVLLLVAAVGFFGAGSRKVVASETVVVSVDPSQAAAEPLRHVWSYFGYDECNYTTTPAARTLMTTLAQTQSAPVYLRQHFLLVNGDGKPSLKWGSTNVYREDASGRAIYDWQILDEIFDTLQVCGCRPLVEIGFMPKDLSSRPEPYQRPDFGKVGGGVSYPPKDYAKWGELIRQWARHSQQRYPHAEAEWLWQLWNEPNNSYWKGTHAEFCKLYDHTEAALHEVLPKAALGGPHVAGPDIGFLSKFLEHTARGRNDVSGKSGTRLDYIGFHAKGRTTFVDGHVRMALGTNLANNRNGFAAIARFPEYRKTPIILGECDPEGAAALSSRVERANGYRNGSAYAAYEVALMKHTLDLATREGVELQGVVTWAFLFNDRQYFEGFRTLSTNGIAKPVLNAFQMLGRLRGNRVPVQSSGALGLTQIVTAGIRQQPDIDGLATATPETVQVVLWNYHDDMVAVPATPIRLSIKAPASRPTQAQVTHHRIDDTHSNAYTRWLALGSPQKPDATVLAKLREAARLTLLEPPRLQDVRNGELELQFELPRYGVSLVEVRWQP